MLKASNSLPISNFSQVVVSDNAGSTFKPKTNSRIRVVLPAQLGMIDFESHKRTKKQFSYQVISDLCSLSMCVTSSLQVLPCKGYQQFILV